MIAVAASAGHYRIRLIDPL